MSKLGPALKAGLEALRVRRRGGYHGGKRGGACKVRGAGPAR